MKLLFVHQNFPGQFLKLAPAMVYRGHDVVAISEFKNKNKTDIKTLRYKHEAREVDSNQAKLGRNYTLTSDRGTIVAKACHSLHKSHGYVPDVILGHSGWGETLFLKSVWPEAKLLVYSEFYYRGDATDIGFDPEFFPHGFDQLLFAQGRAAHMAQSLAHSDAGLSPTHWQADTHPPILRKMIRVIHDGIDTRIAVPDPNAQLKLPNGNILKVGDEVLTFINRNLEPYRGYHVFMRALPKIMRERPNVQVVIIGGDRVSYGPPPKGKNGWKEIFIDEVKDQVDMSRIHFFGRVPYSTFIKAMQISQVHAYLTYPFVLSWSMLEAMAAGCIVVGSKTQPVEEVITHGKNGLLVDFFDVAEWSRVLTDVLANPDKYKYLRSAARACIVKDYDLQTVCLPKLIDFIEGFSPNASGEAD